MAAITELLINGQGKALSFNGSNRDVDEIRYTIESYPSFYEGKIKDLNNMTDEEYIEYVKTYRIKKCIELRKYCKRYGRIGHSKKINSRPAIIKFTKLTIRSLAFQILK